jgi:hypothetical protein
MAKPTAQPSSLIERTYKIGINTKIIGKCDPQQLSYPGAWRNVSCTIEQLGDHIGAGHPWMPAQLNNSGERWQVNANHIELLGVDIDSGMTIAQALAHPFIKAHCGLLIESASSTPEHNKFRLVFPLAGAIDGWQNIRMCNRYLIELIGVADKACKDASRFFFGAPGRQPILVQSAELPADFLDQMLAWNANLEAIALREQQRRANYLASIDTSDQANLVQQALAFIPPYTPGNGTYDDLIVMMAGVVNDLGSEGEALLEAWGGFGRETAKKVDGLKRTPNKKATVGTVFHLAKEYGFQFPKKQKTPRNQSKQPIAQAQLSAPEQSIMAPVPKMRRSATVKDSELAEFAVSKWQGDLIYSSEIESWVRYGQTQEGVWSVVSEDSVASEALDLAHELAGEFKWSLVAGGVKAARVNKKILKPSMPTSPDMLIFQNGALKISTGKLLPHSRNNNALWALQRKYDPDQRDWSPIAEFVSKALWSKADQDRMVAFHAATVRDLFRKMQGADKKNTLLQIGESGAGKGTSTRLMEQLVGEPNVKPIESIQALCSKDFGLDGIESENPRLLIVADQEKLPPRLPIARFLLLTGLDLVDVSRKYKRGARYRHTGGSVINSTEYIWSAYHRSRGATRRTVLIQSWRKDPALSGIESRFMPEVISAYTNFLLSLPEQWILDTLESAPGEPTIENEADNPMMAWFMDCVEITGDAADRVQLGRDKNAAEQLFSSYFSYCEKANIGSAYSKNHVTFAKEFEQIYARLKSTRECSGKEFGHVRPGNKLHYIGLRLKSEADDSSRLQQFEALRPEQSPIDSPVQLGIANQLGSVEEPESATVDASEDLTIEYDCNVKPEPLEAIEPPLQVGDWQPAIGEEVAFQRSGVWVAATVSKIPTDEHGQQCTGYKIALPNCETDHAWDLLSLRPLDRRGSEVTI